jgi:hypothetical protein
MSEIPEHIKFIYRVALGYGVPLRKMLHNGVENKYNRNFKASTFIAYYLITEKKKDERDNEGCV